MLGRAADVGVKCKPRCVVNGVIVRRIAQRVEVVGVRNVVGVLDCKCAGRVTGPRALRAGRKAH